MNGNGTLDLASADRITDSVTTFAQLESAWWRVVQTKGKRPPGDLLDDDVRQVAS